MELNYLTKEAKRPIKANQEKKPWKAFNSYPTNARIRFSVDTAQKPQVFVEYAIPISNQFQK
ncbi:CFC_HP_G0057180.mRNA.1.CDS.1 [Saccharomyces cerevisiae]|nr:CFC_HP_G0057180.mRNA.1.CDS.1 [Saccharomyces cerevisiae]CAI6540277.1 CFC_HP_G0057180.mRNA.1.CDS.1 [Saccharomyces cerevisiae]